MFVFQVFQSRARHALGLLAVFLVIFAATLAVAEQALRQADRFVSSGDEIEGWYWLRDPTLSASAEFEFASIPPEGDVILVIDALATDRASGGPGFAGTFDLLFGFPGSGMMGGVFNRIPVTLPNVSPPGDPLGYRVRGAVVLPRADVERLLPPTGKLFIRIVRNSAGDPHVAFNASSVRMLVPQPDGVLPPASGTLQETSGPHDATELGSGAWAGGIGAPGDEEDWFTLILEEGQVVRAQLDASPGLSAALRLRSPAGQTRAEVFVPPGGSGQLRRAADEGGNWQLQIVRRQGAGDYTLFLDIANQDDAGQGLDAGATADGALPIDDGLVAGQVLRGDDTDWYRIALEAGEILDLQLVAPAGARLSLVLEDPNGTRRRDAVSTPNSPASIRHAANLAGDWLIRVRRTAGEGEYGLRVSREQQSDGGQAGDAADTAEGATTLDIGTATGRLLAADDIDMYSFDAEPGDIVEVAVTSASEGLRLSMSLRDARGQSVRGPETVPSLGTGQLRFAVPDEGPWYLRIARLAGGGAYSVDLAVTPQRDGGVPGDAGDTAELAGPIEPGPQLGELVAADNRDVFRLSVQRGDIVETRVGNLSDTLRLSVSILNGAGSMVAGPEALAPFEEVTLRHAASAAGDAFVRLVRSAGAGVYAINAATFHQDDGGSGGDAGPCSEGPVALAAPVTNGWMLRGDTDDCYTVTLAEGDTIGLSLNTDARLETRELVLRRPGGSSIQGTGENRGEIEHTATQAGDYLVLVRRLSGDGPYRIDVSIDAPYPTGPGGTEPTGGLSLEEGTTDGTPGDENGDAADGTSEGLPPIDVTVANGGHRLIADQSIYATDGAEDTDLDGLRQDWEDAAARLAQPWLELDEEEDWLVRRPEHKAHTLVRVRPYANAQGTRYVLMHFVTTWTRDYGRFTVELPPVGDLFDFREDVAHAHNGDISTAILAWRVTDDQTVDLEAVYTSAHHTSTLHSGVWTANGESCNYGRTYNGQERWLCATLEFQSNRLVLQASEDKHALFPTVGLCEDVILLQIGMIPFGEDCGGGGLHLFDMDNVGEFDNPMDVDISALFPGESVWADQGFCGGRGSTWDRSIGCAGPIRHHLTNEDAMLLRWLAGLRPEPPFEQQVLETISGGLDAVIDVIDSIEPPVELPIDLDDITDMWPF